MCSSKKYTYSPIQNGWKFQRREGSKAQAIPEREDALS